MLAANDDWEGCEGVLTHVPRAVHGNESIDTGEHHILNAEKIELANTEKTEIGNADGYGMLTLTGGQRIPQVHETCGYVYTSCDYAVGTLDRAWAGGMNDCGVAVAGTGVDAYKPLSWKQKGWLLEPDDIPLLVLQRGTSARQAVRMIGNLINAYGLRPSYVEGAAGSSAATFSIADKEEGWVLEVYPGTCWVAVRVPDDSVSVRVNAFGTHDADLTDAQNTMSSPGLAAYARERGLWDGDERHFDFAAAFGSETSPTEWGPEKDPMNLRRRWRAMYLVDKREEPEETLRYLARPADRADSEGKVQPADRADLGGKTQPAEGERKKKETLPLRERAAGGNELSAKDIINEPWRLGIADMMNILSDVYDGTQYDLRKVTEAGPGQDPFADGMPDYALCRQYTLASFVTDYVGEKDEPLMWTAMGIPRLVPYIPIWVDTESEFFPENVMPKSETRTKDAETKEKTYSCASLYRVWKRYCDNIRSDYRQLAGAAQKRKAEYQEKMQQLVCGEAEAGQADGANCINCKESRQNSRAVHTGQNEAHISEAWKYVAY